MNPDFRFDTKHIQWTPFEGSDDFDNPIDYEMAVLGAQPEHGRIDLLVKWAPNAYCHFHRHCADSTILVLEGEQHIIETAADGSQLHKVRKAGTYAFSPGGDVHQEHGGPEGALVLFNILAPQGKVFDMLDREENILASASVADMAREWTAFPDRR